MIESPQAAALLRRAALSFGLFAWPAVGAQAQEVRLPSPGVVAEGEALVSELGCINCHPMEGPLVARLAPKRAPNLEQVGARRTPASLWRLLSDPHGDRPGTSMPDVLAALPEAARREAMEDLVYYLVSRGGPLDVTPFAVDESMLAEGRQLLHEVGCVACHLPEEPLDSLYEPYRLGEEPEEAAPEAADDERYVPPGTLDPPRVPFGDLARRTTVGALQSFLLAPRAARPSGRMPSMNLSEREARDIAAYLLRAQVVEGRYSESPGLSYAYYEQTFPSGTPELEGLAPARLGTWLDEVRLPDHRPDYFAFEFQGVFEAPRAGTYLFRSTSDDGSWIWIDGQLVLDNGGIHGTRAVEGAVDLSAGTHRFRLLFYEHGGGSQLQVDWSGPGFEQRRLRGDDFVHRSIPMAPPVEAGFRLDDGRAERGRDRFVELGCAACHEQPEARARPLERCDPNSSSGCLSERGGARFGWSAAQREAVRGFLAELGSLAPEDDEGRARRALAANRCYSCHRRDDLGGPHPDRLGYFFAIEDVDLGDEGRIPPLLDAVGAKLHPGWLREVLQESGSVRPYLATRMPQFDPAAMEELQATLMRADREEDPPQPLPFSTEAMLAGRRLVGTEGLGCIQCHTFKGYRSLGIPAVDLATVKQRVRYPWFRKLLADPIGLGMNTRMPEFWIDGESPVKDVLGGDVNAQIDAVWNYLSLGSSMPLPPGLDVPDSAYELELAAGDPPRLVGVFMEGLSPRVVAVGTAAHVHYAFDVENSRLAKVWRGRFFNARGTWEGRAGMLESPPSDDVLDLPEGPPFAVLDDPAGEWPHTVGRRPRLQPRGRSYDPERRPIFRYALGEIEIEEVHETRFEEGDGVLLRRFRLSAPAPPENLYFRSTDGPRAVVFEPAPDGGSLAEFEEVVRW